MNSWLPKQISAYHRNSFRSGWFRQNQSTPRAQMQDRAGLAIVYSAGGIFAWTQDGKNVTNSIGRERGPKNVKEDEEG